MNTNTKKRIEFLQQYVLKHYRTWHKHHPANIVGFHIGKKQCDKKKTAEILYSSQAPRKGIC